MPTNQKVPEDGRQTAKAALGQYLAKTQMLPYVRLLLQKAGAPVQKD